VKASSGVVIALATKGDEEIKEAADHIPYLPAAPEELSPILEIVPL
jgi:glucosamine--fructose-6-phosphate aminotransferase (isomerizing)